MGFNTTFLKRNGVTACFAEGVDKHVYTIEGVDCPGSQLSSQDNDSIIAETT